jgi:hypothetical protein
MEHVSVDQMIVGIAHFCGIGGPGSAKAERCDCCGTECRNWVHRDEFNVSGKHQP